MAVAVPAPSALSGELTLFHTTDPLLSNSPVFVFHGPASTIGATSSRIQIHIFTAAGHASYARLAVSPNSPFYSAVSNLPREEQGDEIVRGVAFGLKKYFAELPDAVKRTWCAEVKAPTVSALFGDEHVAILASRLDKIENVNEVIGEIQEAFGEQTLSWLDVDVVLPCGSIKEFASSTDSAGSLELDESQHLLHRYGRYAELVACFGDSVFMPTSSLKRAPSKPMAVGTSQSFSEQQREKVQAQLIELLETEHNYIERITELNDLSKALGTGLDGSNQENLRNVFPDSIHEIARLNSEFLRSLRALFDQYALEDIEAMKETLPTARRGLQDVNAETQGISAIANCLCDWFPKFSDSYREYLRSHATSAQLLRNNFKSADSAVTNQLQDVGEQRLTSLFIEPVQRLPRYTLYIDGIIKQLPVRHPAIKSFLKARDVITEICNSNEADAAGPAAILKLRSRISGWPAEAHIGGRFVTAADYVELMPPYGLQRCDADHGMVLVFTDGLVFVEKRGNNATSARTLQMEIESGQAPLRQAKGRPGSPYELRFSRRVQLDAVDCLEFQNGYALQVFSSFQMDAATDPPLPSVMTSYQVLRLEGLYEHKAERLAQEITKARVEGRFSEPERESQEWEVRASEPGADTCGLFSAVFEDSNPLHVGGRSSSTTVRVIVDIDKHHQRPRAGQNGIRTVVSLSPMRDSLWRLAIDSIDGSVTSEHVAMSDLIPALRRKLTALVSARFSIDQAALMTCLLAKNADILRSLKVQFSVEEEAPNAIPNPRDRINRPLSPKKFLSSFLSSTNQPPVPLKKDLPSLQPPIQLPRKTKSNQVPQKPPSRESRPSSKDHSTPMSVSSAGSAEQLESSSKKLEDTLSAYILALQARKGNIVGRTLKMREAADELAVNELYNSLLEDPSMMVLAAQAPVDVLFAAFEKFLNIAWLEQMGQVLPFSILQDIQAKAETMFPSEFDKFFKSTINMLAPQNHRAFKCIMKLLSDLLDGTGNDGDRGILTAAFAEVLVTDGNPHDYIALIDRFVDDPDTYFGEPLEEAQKIGEASFNPHKRARSANSTSNSSNTSSLRKKFGFGGLSRENSKSEQESVVASVWRTLSKSTRGEATSPGNSISKGSLHRSYSTDHDLGRPGSQEGASSLKSSTVGDESSFSAMSSTHNLGLSTIGEHPSFIATPPPRKKRRSSLSDLKTLEVTPHKSPAWSPPAARRPPVSPDKSLPNSPMASTPSSKGGSWRVVSPNRDAPRSKLPSSFRKENSPGSIHAYSATEQRPKSSGGKLDEAVITARPISGIPTLAPRTTDSPQKSLPLKAGRTGLAERSDGGNIMKLPSPQAEKATKPANSALVPAGSPKKLRMQSPQKLRERLQNEQSFVSAAHTSLQEELSKIGDELTSTPSRIGSVRTSTTPRTRTSTAQSSTIGLAQRVLKMEGRLPTQIEDLHSRINTIQTDLTNSLTVSETKCKKLDDLYREANGENEALYLLFNDELSRILKAVKGGEGVEELRKTMKENQEEVLKLRRENVRLKRENVGLRAQLRE